MSISSMSRRLCDSVNVLMSLFTRPQIFVFRWSIIITKACKRDNLAFNQLLMLSTFKYTVLHAHLESKNKLKISNCCLQSRNKQVFQMIQMFDDRLLWHNVLLTIRYCLKCYLYVQNYVINLISLEC